jgi:cytochrome c-type biogenesis protein CcmI
MAPLLALLAQEDTPSFPDPSNGIFDHFGLIFGIILAIVVVTAIVGLRTTWLQGTFLGRSRVNVDYDDTQQRRTAEERLTELKRLRDQGVIEEAEYQSARAEVLRDVADG